MRGGRTPFILVGFLLGLIYLLYRQEETWIPHLNVYTGTLEVGNEAVQVVQTTEQSTLPGYCEYCGPEDTYCNRYGY